MFWLSVLSNINKQLKKVHFPITKVANLVINLFEFLNLLILLVLENDQKICYFFPAWCRACKLPLPMQELKLNVKLLLVNILELNKNYFQTNLFNLLKNLKQNAIVLFSHCELLPLHGKIYNFFAHTALHSVAMTK